MAGKEKGVVYGFWIPAFAGMTGVCGMTGVGLLGLRAEL